MGAAQPQIASAQELLEDLCALGHAAEIHYWHHNEPRTARTQLIELHEDCIYISKPQCIGADVVIRSDTPLTVYVPYRKEIYAFRSRVLRPQFVFDLNQRKRIVGASIERPTRIEPQQRRHDYRVSLAVHQVSVALHRLGEEGFTLAPIDALRFHGRLTNISTSGLAMLVPKHGCPRLKLWDPFMALFRLPGEDRRFVLPVQVRHARLVHEDQDVTIGLRVSDPDDHFVRTQLHRVSRFITAEQRRQLQAGRL